MDADESSIGFHYSNNQNRRRRPTYGVNGWNYKPTMCNSIKVECKAGEDCQYCHNREELVYHPLVFKTKLCEYMVDDKNFCTKYGRHCAKAHSNEDKRIASNNKPAETNSGDDLQMLTNEVLKMISENKNS